MTTKQKDVSVIGTGYVGLVTGVCLAQMGHNLICIDINVQRINSLSQGLVPFYEPGLEECLKENIKAGRLKFTTNIEKGIEKSKIIMLCLPTPEGSDGNADLSAVAIVAKQIAKIIKEYKIIVTKSTVPVGTGEKLRKMIRAEYRGEFEVVSNPEFLREGKAVKDFLTPNRIIVGTSSQRALKDIKELYEPITTDKRPLVSMDIVTSELVKYAANAMLATRISFINELANLADSVGANIKDIQYSLGLDSRIGYRYLRPGIGYGGSCLPKDTKALAITGRQYNSPLTLIETVINANKAQHTIFLNKIISHYNTSFFNKYTFTVWGLSFNPGTDDTRESSAYYLIKKLITMGAQIQAYDPEAMDHFRKNFIPPKQAENMVTYCNSALEACNQADALIICTEWDEFIQTELSEISQRLKKPLIFDGRNIFALSEVKKHRIMYYSVGRPSVFP